MTIPLVVAIVALCLVIFGLMWVIRILLARVTVLTNAFARASVGAMSDARAIARQVSENSTSASERLFAALRDTTSRQASDMMDLARTAWSPVPAQAVDPGQEQTPQLTPLYAGENTDNELDPTDELIPSGGKIGDPPGAHLIMQHEDANEPFGHLGLKAPNLEDMFGPMKKNF